jgi:hypothetical protein
MYFNKLWIAFIVFLLLAAMAVDGVLGILGDPSSLIIQQLKVIMDLYMPA